jgi:hypothetical protein
VVRLDGQYGNGAIVADLAGLAYVMRGKDYDLLNLHEVQARLAQLPDQQTTHPEAGTCRALFDCPDLLLTPAGPRARVIVATHPATEASAKIGTTQAPEQSTCDICTSSQGMSPVSIVAYRCGVIPAIPPITGGSTTAMQPRPGVFPVLLAGF